MSAKDCIWVSVDKKVPTHDDDILIYHEGEIVTGRYWPEISKFLSSDVKAKHGGEVTHWMQMPKPPQELIL